MRACQLKHLWLTHRYRGQAPSHIWISTARSTIALAISTRCNTETTSVCDVPSSRSPASCAVAEAQRSRLLV